LLSVEKYSLIGLRSIAEDTTYICADQVCNK